VAILFFLPNSFTYENII